MVPSLPGRRIDERSPPHVALPDPLSLPLPIGDLAAALEPSPVSPLPPSSPFPHGGVGADGAFELTPMSSLPFFLPLLSLLPHLVAAPPRAGRARRPSEPAQVLPSSFSLHLCRRRRLRRGRTDAAPVVAVVAVSPPFFSLPFCQRRQPSPFVSLLSVSQRRRPPATAVLCQHLLRPPPLCPSAPLFPPTQIYGAAPWSAAQFLAGSDSLTGGERRSGRPARMEEADWQKLAVEISIKPVPFKHPGPTSSAHEAISGTDTLRSLPVGSSAPGKADKKCALFYGVTISEEQARSGIVVRVNSAAQSEFKLLFFEQEFDGGYGLALQASKLRENRLHQASVKRKTST
uniref:Uncharacterized protein n=2 Tax=Oryza TaxID=4527 RepID=A0A0E0NSS8_ORYRU